MDNLFHTLFLLGFFKRELLRSCQKIYSEPKERFFEIIKALNPHAPIDCDGFSKPLRVKYWLFKQICKLWGTKYTTIYYVLINLLGCKVSVDKTFKEFDITLEFPPIKKNPFSIVFCNDIKNLKKGSLSLFHRELTSGNYMKQFWFDK